MAAIVAQSKWCVRMPEAAIAWYAAPYLQTISWTSGVTAYDGACGRTAARLVANWLAGAIPALLPMNAIGQRGVKRTAILPGPGRRNLVRGGQVRCGRLAAVCRHARRVCGWGYRAAGLRAAPATYDVPGRDHV